MQSVSIPGEIIVKVHSSSKEKKMAKHSGYFEVWVKEPANDDKANLQVIKMISREIGSQVRIKRGRTSKEKIMVKLDKNRV